MFKSKPIGWITAGTLFCVASVAVACRLRDGKSTAPEATAAVCPAVAGEPMDEAPTAVKTPSKPKDEGKKESPSPLNSEKPPMVGELVAPAASVAKEEKNPKDAAQSVDSLSMRPLELVKKV